ncbi:MAG: galactokinase [Lachnospiraceae bacterium]|nr:galactokinase [Lachnospiraceae bacterium]
MAMPSEEALKKIYGDKAAEAADRFESLSATFGEKFGGNCASCFSAPGRTEIIGNHTDHNGGKILAASITMDTIAAARPNTDGVITIYSSGYDNAIIVDTNALDSVPHRTDSTSLVAGICKAALEFGFRIGGFDACVSTQVISSAGVSSSASFEMLICTILNSFYNNGTIDCAHYARMGQYAENHFWDKASGLMDQMACAVGGTILLDFSDGVKFEKVDFSFDSLGYDLIIVNTGKGHADLSAEYSSVPNEMREVAALLGVGNLCETSEETLLARLPEIRSALGNDRAILRALHYFEECKRVDEAAAALREGHADRIPGIIRESGNSSWKWLQNCYIARDPKEQSIPLTLALAEIYMKKIGSGVCRIHGGGFAGVVMCVLPKKETAGFVKYMTPFAGEKNIYVMGIRQTGAVEVQ